MEGAETATSGVHPGPAECSPACVIAQRLLGVQATSVPSGAVQASSFESFFKGPLGYPVWVRTARESDWQ